MLVTAHPQPDLSAHGSVAPPTVRLVVLDTNVVLDWLWFDDPRVGPLAAAVQTGDVRWLATAAMRRELELVLERWPTTHRLRPPEQTLASFDRWSSQAQPAPLFERLRCSDSDDQKFIDLALAAAASCLVSRDKAVLRLARRAAAFGLAIVAPERWT